MIEKNDDFEVGDYVVILETSKGYYPGDTCPPELRFIGTAGVISDLEYHYHSCCPDAVVVLRGRREKVLIDLNFLEKAPTSKFKIGDRVRKIKGSNWHGVVVGTYSTELTPEGYAVESSTECGSVQIYPAEALEHWDE